MPTRLQPAFQRAALPAAAATLTLVTLLTAPRAHADAEGAVLDEIVVTARLRAENAERVPIALSVVDATTLERTDSNNLSQLSLLVPALNYVSPNPRNTAYTIRGLGSSVVAVSQANDGLEPGVGFYVDQVYHARPATAAFDFADLERVEVLRGPQGTLFGKNTTAGAISLTTRAPTFTPEAFVDVSLGDFNFQQARGAVSGAIVGEELAGRLSASVTERDGVLRNVRTGARVNDVRNAGFRGQLLYVPAQSLRVRLSADYSSFDGACCAQVYYGVGTSLKPASRQYPSMAAALGYAPPSTNPYDRLTDIDAAVAVATNEGGVAATVDWDVGPVTVTSISAWRFWNWDAANDRDYTGVSIQTLQHIPSRQDQYSQELRVASQGQHALDWVGGLYAFAQTIVGEPITQYGPLATFWLLGPSPAYPSNLLDGYGTDGHTRFHSSSTAAFAEATWHATQRLSVTAGARYTSEHKDGEYATTVYGGLATSNPALVKAQLSILRPQSYTASVADGSPSGRVHVAYQWTPDLMTYLGYADGHKSGGINMSGLPLNAANLPALATAVIRPERNRTAEIGLKAVLLDRRVTFNADLYDTDVRDFQTNVVDTGPGALRGYLANIEQVRVRGAEIDVAARAVASLTLTASGAWTHGHYVTYRNGPCPLEQLASTTTVCDLSGRPLSSTPSFAGSLGAEYVHALGGAGELFARADVTTRGDSYGDPSDSRYTVIGGYTVVNASIGWRHEHVELYAWSRNLANRDYMQNLTIQAGNSGLILGTPGDPRTIGVTLRATY